LPQQPREPQKPQQQSSAAAQTVAVPDVKNDVEIDALLNGRHTDPFALLGPHPVPGGWVIRFFIPWAAEASIDIAPGQPVLNSMKITDAVKIRPEGFFEALWPSNQSAPPAPGSYKIRGRTHHGEAFEMYDAYSFPYLLSEFDLYLMGEGRHYDTYEKLGASAWSAISIGGMGA
jgi:1,4-alpha-glucan branching enzyme